MTLCNGAPHLILCMMTALSSFPASSDSVSSFSSRLGKVVSRTKWTSAYSGRAVRRSRNVRYGDIVIIIDNESLSIVIKKVQ